jgi:hypothetical protein
MYRYTWIDVEDGSIWETLVDASYANWSEKGWDRLSREETVYGIYTGLTQTRRKTRVGYGVLTADTQAQLVEACHNQVQAMEVIMELERLRACQKAAREDPVTSP